MLGGDLPFLKKFLGLTEHWYIPSVHNLGLWNPLKRRYLGCHRRRTRTGDASRLGKTPICKGARGCASKPLLQLPRHHAIICVLHMLMRIGALLGEYLERLCLSASREARNAINNMLKIALCGWQLVGTCRPDGQELAQLALHNPHIWANSLKPVLCSAIASPSLLSSSPIRVNPKPSVCFLYGMVLLMFWGWPTSTWVTRLSCGCGT